MPRMEAQVPNFSSNMQQKLQEFKQAFSQEIPSVEQSKNEFKKPANPVKSKKKHGRSDIMQQILKRKSSSDENDGDSSLNSSQSSFSLPSQVDSVQKGEFSLHFFSRLFSCDLIGKVRFATKTFTPKLRLQGVRKRTILASLETSP